MFTGIVREVGAIEAIERSEAGARLRISAGFAPELSQGDSIAVGGVCLTAASVGAAAFEADVMNQTLELTRLGRLGEGDGVNLEPALRAGDPMGGHIVQGHVDCVGEVAEVGDDGFARRIRIGLPGELRRYTVSQGSVALDGVSLTVAALTPDGFEVSLIPETLARTTLGRLEAGAPVNVELDVIARYVERLLGFKTEGSTP